jgi:hypothetical protein
LSIYRYITIKKQSINSLKYHNLIILLIILFCIFISIPSYLYPDILKQNSTSNDSSFVYLIRQSDLNIQTNNLIVTGQSRIENTTVATYDLGDDIFVLVTYLTKSNFIWCTVVCY